MTNKKKPLIKGFALVAFFASLAGIYISFGLLKEDVLSTALTVFNYFPLEYGVTPATDMQGAMILGWFTTVLQIVTAGIIFSNGYFPKITRWIAIVSFALACGFDNWTDIVHRSGYLTGNMKVSIVTTFSFYTVGSEVLQALSWAVMITFWRTAISDVMWGWAVFLAGIRSIKNEMNNFHRSAGNIEKLNRNSEGANTTNNNNNKKPYTPNKPQTYTRPQDNKPSSFKAPRPIHHSPTSPLAGKSSNRKYTEPVYNSLNNNQTYSPQSMSNFFDDDDV